MQPLVLTLKRLQGIRDGLGLDEITLDFERLTGARNWWHLWVPTAAARAQSWKV